MSRHYSVSHLSNKLTEVNRLRDQLRLQGKLYGPIVLFHQIIIIIFFYQIEMLRSQHFFTIFLQQTPSSRLLKTLTY